MKGIDFDNADVMIAGCVLIILALVAAAAIAKDIALADVKELITYFALIGSSLATPDKVAGLIKRRMALKAPSPTPPKPEEARP